MKKIIIATIFFFSLLYEKLDGQECITTTGCSNFFSQYPAGTLTPTTSWTTINGMNGGNWTWFNVIAGNTYEWTYCESVGGISTSWDAQLTLYNVNGGLRYCYSDDNCGTNNNAPYIRWTAPFTETVRLLTSVFNCATNAPNPPYNRLAYRVVPTSTYNFTTTVFNVTGSTRSDARVRLYNSAWSPLLTQFTNSSGQTTFTGLANGTYNYEVYYTPTNVSPPTTPYEEFWGTGSFTISGSSISQSFTRSQPYIFSAPSFSPFSLSIGQSTIGTFVVKNALPYATTNTYVEIWTDRSQSSPFDYYNSASPRSIGSGATSNFNFSVSPANTGTHYFYAFVKSFVNSAYIITDQYAWTSGFSVSCPSLTAPTSSLVSNINTLTPTFSWSGNSSGIYHVQIWNASTNPTTDENVIYGFETPASSPGHCVSGLIHTIQSGILADNTQYKWSVHRNDPCGECESASTPIQFFTINTSPCLTPSNQASNISFNGNDGISITANWSNGNGSARIVKVNTINSFSTPGNGVAPSGVNNTYQNAGEQIVYYGSGSNVYVNNLMPGQTYYFRVYEANCSGSQIVYNTASNTGNPAQVTMINGLTPIADFTTSNGVIVAGQSTQIFNASSNATSYSWAIHREVWNGSLQLDYSSSAQNISFDFPYAACYRVTLTAYNGANSDTKIRQCYIYAKPNLNAPIPPDVTRAQQYFTYHDGDPVNLTNGTFSFSMRDLSITGIKTKTVLERRYFSNSGYESIFGVGWHHSFDIKVNYNNLSDWFVQYPDGHNEHFVPYVNGETKSMYPGNFDSLSYIASGSVMSSFTVWKKDGTHWLFNGNGQIVSIIDLDGNQTQFSYTAGKLSTVTSPGGRTLQLNYNASNKVTSVVDNSGRSVYYFYNASGQLDSTRIGNSTTSFRYGPYGITEVYDPRGNRILQNVYNAQSQVIEQYDAENQRTTFQYDIPVSLTTTVTDPTLHSKVIKHDTRARCTEVLNEAGFTEKYAYSPSNTLDTITNALGYKTIIEYDERGNSIKTTDANGFSDSIGYNLINKPTYIRDKENNIYQTIYSSSGNPTRIVSPTSDTIKYEYDSRGLDTAIIDPRGFRTRKIYNSFGDLAQLITPASQTSFSYDAAGRLVEITDSYGRKDSLFWNYFDLPVKRKDKMGFVEEFEYDRNGNLVLYRDNEGRSTTTDYNKFDKPVKVINPLNHITEVVYDELQRPIKYRDANKNVTITDYDPIGQEVQVRDSVLGILSMNMIDQVGNIIYKSDGLGNIWERRYDPGGRVSSLINPLGDSIKYKYNKVNNVTEIIDQEGKSVKWEYDALGRHVKTTDALNNYVQLYYNKTGQLDSVSDARGNVRNKALYDGSGKLLSLNDGFGTHSMDWDSAGNVRTITDPDGRVTNYLYNDNSELITVTSGTNIRRTYILNNNGQYLQANSVTQNSSIQRNSAGWITQYTDNFSNTTSHVYDSLGLIKKIIYPGGKTAEYRYNSLNKCIEVKDWYDRVYTINRDKNGGITSIIYPNNFSIAISRDMAYRVKAWVNADDTGGVFQSNLLKLSKTGNVERDSGIHVLPFIPLPLDAAGVYGPDDRMLSYGEATISSNNSGQRIEKAGPADTVRYRWSPMSELDTITQNGVVSIQKYDAFNERTVKEHAGVETRFVVDHGVAEFPIILQERNGLNTELINYLFIPGEGILLGRDSAGAFRFYHHNLFGNTIALSDLSGAITDRYEYSILTDTFYHAGPSTQPATWMGMYGVQYDGNGLYYVHARYYDGKTGTFISRDPNSINYRNTQDIDRYVYGYNNPLKYNDPTGLFLQNISYEGLGFWDKTKAIWLDSWNRAWERGMNSLKDPETWKIAFQLALLRVDIGQLNSVKGAGLNTRFVATSNGVIHDLQITLDRIGAGLKLQLKNDGAVFKNFDGFLPKNDIGYYREFIHPTPGISGKGALRIVTGQNGEMWFTLDHYKTFIKIK